MGVDWKEYGKYRFIPGYSGVTVLGDQVLVMDRPPVKGGRETERALCVERQSGKKIWEFVYEAKYKKLDYDKGPRASLTIQDNRVYGLGSMGHAFCLDLRTGKQEWFRDLLKEEGLPFPIWGFSASPEILGEVVLYHVGGEKGRKPVSFESKEWKKSLVSGRRCQGWLCPIRCFRNGGRKATALLGAPIRSWDCQLEEEQSFGVFLMR
jgi:outer membrane protein assembly factor BamB